MTTAQSFLALVYADVYAYTSDPVAMSAAGLVLMVVAFWLVIFLAIMRLTHHADIGTLLHRYGLCGGQRPPHDDGDRHSRAWRPPTAWRPTARRPSTPGPRQSAEHKSEQTSLIPRFGASVLERDQDAGETIARSMGKRRKKREDAGSGRKQKERWRAGVYMRLQSRQLTLGGLSQKNCRQRLKAG
jgi:hypothetical protein